MNKKLTSRERIWRTINFQEADRVPIDIGSNDATGINVDAYIELVKYLDYKIEAPKVNEFFYMLARIDETVRQRLHCDVIQLENPSPRWNINNNGWKKWTNERGSVISVPEGFNPVRDGNGDLLLKDKNGKVLARMPKGGLYFDYIEPTSLSGSEIQKTDPDAWAKSLPLYSEIHLRQLETEAKWLHENTEYSISGAFAKGGMSMVPGLAWHSISDWLCLLMTDPDYTYSIIQASAQRAVENLELYLQAVGNYIDTIFVSPTDYGTQNGELFNPDIWRDIYLPNYKIINDYVHNHTHAKVFLHCCGSIYNLIEYFIQAGVDILNPVQTNARNMDPCKLKEEFGKRIVFWGGGMETQTVLPFGSRSDVVEQVKERIRIFAPGGGFVFNQVHCIQYGVPPENILAMVDAVIEFGEYRVI